MKKLIKKKEYHYRPRWSIMLFDISVIAIIHFLIYSLFSKIIPIEISPNQLIVKILLSLPWFIAGWLVIKPHQAIIRYFSITDIVKFIYANLIGSLGVLLISTVALYFNILSIFKIPYIVIFFNFCISILVIIFFRIAVKIFDRKVILNRVLGKRILIYGAGRLGIVTKDAIEQDNSNRYNIVGFIDSNPLFSNRKISGKQVYNEEYVFSKLNKELFIDEIIIANDDDTTSKNEKRKLVENCFKNNITIREVPAFSKWLNGTLNSSQIKEVEIEELLGREPIVLDKSKIETELNGKSILVTGAAGSIGSELVRQIANFNPSSLVLVDNAETPLFNLQNEINALKLQVKIIFVLGDTKDTIRMNKIFKTYGPEIIFHASAYKHVPLMEDYPYEAIRNNILSVKVLSDLAVKYEANKFVMISTDKAVNPTNVMGASKRICEMYAQALSISKNHKTEFITTRFGNVLGSNGSVIPIFKKQIKNGGPITITHKDIIRYFMTIPEACQLVLEASFMGKGGEIYIFDMGQPVKIYDLAEKMIFLSGLKPHMDIKITEIGLRPGEKLYEELLNDKEKTLPTHHERIMIAKTSILDYKFINSKITGLIESLSMANDDELVSRMKDLISEFISNNSRFEKLDKKFLENS